MKPAINNIHHISVCICTFKRPDLLMRLLLALEDQITNRLFNFSVIIADNDQRQSAKQVVSNFSATSLISVTYCVEPEQNIALARNKTLEYATGDFVAIIDDDEVPEKDWLYSLYKTCLEYKVAGVLGPVKPYFEHEPPHWVLKGKFFERPIHETGYRIGLPDARTGNLLFRREIINGLTEVFRPQFGTGSEDVDFFRRMIENGREFIWCNKAVVKEVVPPARSKRRYLLKLALLRGNNLLNHQMNLKYMILKSLIAIPIYTLFLPFLFIIGHHHFMKYIIKLCDHAGRLLGLLGMNPVHKKDIT